jgi:transcriptional regulator with XRE-family HTH domain
MRMTLMRKQRGWSQARLAREAGLCQSTLSQIESGRFKPYRGQLDKLAQALSYKGNPEDLLVEAPANGGCQNMGESEGEKS